MSTAHDIHRALVNECAHVRCVRLRGEDYITVSARSPSVDALSDVHTLAEGAGLVGWFLSNRVGPEIRLVLAPRPH